MIVTRMSSPNSGCFLRDDELRHNDWVLGVSDADYSTAAITYTGNESNRIVDSESYTEFLQLARRLTVDIGDVNQAFFDVQIGWDHNTIPILESTEIEPYTSKFTSRSTSVLLSETLSGSRSTGNGLIVENFGNEDFTNRGLPIALDMVALQQGASSVIRGST